VPGSQDHDIILRLHSGIECAVLPLLATPKPWRRRVPGAENYHIVFSLDRAHTPDRDRLNDLSVLISNVSVSVAEIW
jgi:hypothetical protein